MGGQMTKIDVTTKSFEEKWKAEIPKYGKAYLYLSQRYAEYLTTKKPGDEVLEPPHNYLMGTTYWWYDRAHDYFMPNHNKDLLPRWPKGYWDDEADWVYLGTTKSGVIQHEKA